MLEWSNGTDAGFGKRHVQRGCNDSGTRTAKIQSARALWAASKIVIVVVGKLPWLLAAGRDAQGVGRCSCARQRLMRAGGRVPAQVAPERPLRGAQVAAHPCRR